MVRRSISVVLLVHESLWMALPLLSIIFSRFNPTHNNRRCTTLGSLAFKTLSLLSPNIAQLAIILHGVVGVI
jgi:hypothetical protein